jgi:Ca-activated chloride channel family protein
MIEWGSPWAFLLLIPVCLLGYQRRITGINMLAVPQLTSDMTRTTLRLFLGRLMPWVRGIGLVLLVLAMARPHQTRQDVIIESDGLDILLAIDTSGSMKEEDFGVGMRAVTRLEVAKRVVAQFIEGRSYDRIGLVIFGEEAFTQVPLTLDHESLLAVLSHLEIGAAGARGTAIGTALAVSGKRLKDLDAPSKIIILLTDGQNNAGRVSPLEAAEAVGSLGIKIYAVGVGAERRGFMMLGNDGLDEEMLRGITAPTGGQYFRARDTQSLEGIYRLIDKLEPSPAQVRDVVDVLELFHLFLVPGMLLLLLETLLTATWLRRFP